MIFKIWQCSTHLQQRQNIGVVTDRFGKDTRNSQDEDCPFCIIVDLKQQLQNIQDYIKCD